MKQLKRFGLDRRAAPAHLIALEGVKELISSDVSCYKNEAALKQAVELRGCPRSRTSS